MPCGGSFVNFSDICNRPMGKLLCTSVVIQSLKKKVLENKTTVRKCNFCQDGKPGMAKVPGIVRKNGR
jgi:hypothetical protein